MFEVAAALAVDEVGFQRAVQGVRPHRACRRHRAQLRPRQRGAVGELDDVNVGAVRIWPHLNEDRLAGRQNAHHQVKWRCGAHPDRNVVRQHALQNERVLVLSRATPVVDRVVAGH